METKTTTNVLLDLGPQHLAPATRQALFTSLGTLDGVAAVRPSRNAARLVFVDYDPRRTRASAILKLARANGQSAHLIGM